MATLVVLAIAAVIVSRAASLRRVVVACMALEMLCASVLSALFTAACALSLKLCASGGVALTWSILPVSRASLVLRASILSPPSSCASDHTRELVSSGGMNGCVCALVGRVAILSPPPGGAMSVCACALVGRVTVLSPPPPRASGRTLESVASGVKCECIPAEKAVLAAPGELFASAFSAARV